MREGGGKKVRGARRVAAGEADCRSPESARSLRPASRVSPRSIPEAFAGIVHHDDAERRDRAEEQGHEEPEKAAAMLGLRQARVDQRQRAPAGEPFVAKLHRCSPPRGSMHLTRGGGNRYESM